MRKERFSECSECSDSSEFLRVLRVLGVLRVLRVLRALGVFDSLETGGGRLSVRFQVQRYVVALTAVHLLSFSCSNKFAECAVYR